MEKVPIKPTELNHCQLTALSLLPKGTTVYEQGETAHGFYYVSSGLIGTFSHY